MKKQNLFMALAMVAVAAMFGACSSDAPEAPKSGMSLAKTPEFRISSGDEVLFQSNSMVSRVKRNSAANGVTIEQIPFHWSNPVDIFEHFPERQTPDGKFGNYLFESSGKPFNVVLLYSNGGYRHYLGLYWYDEDNTIHEQTFWNEFTDVNKGAKVWENYNGRVDNKQISRKSDLAGAYTICLPAGTRFGFYQVSVKNTNSQTDTVTEGVRLVQPAGPIVACPYKFYTEQEKNWNYSLLAGKDLRCQTMSMQTEINGTTWTIIGMEDISLTYPSCDKDFNDVVFALNPSPKMYTENGSGEWVPTQPEQETIDGSVEVNLSVTDPHENGDYVASKLSIHVRSITDVEVVLPVSMPNYCATDDMDIALSHQVPDVIYNVDPQVVEMQIGNTSVKLMVQFEYNAIRVTTDGINQEVIDYCAKNYGDGITFEVWNYYQSITREELKTLLDAATVEFLDNAPARYINAFGKVNEQQNPMDCQVVPVDNGYTKNTVEESFNIEYLR